MHKPCWTVHQGQNLVLLLEQELPECQIDAMIPNFLDTFIYLALYTWKQRYTWSIFPNCSLGLRLNPELFYLIFPSIWLVLESWDCGLPRHAWFLHIFWEVKFLHTCMALLHEPSPKTPLKFPLPASRKFSMFSVVERSNLFTTLNMLNFPRASIRLVSSGAHRTEVQYASPQVSGVTSWEANESWKNVGAKAHFNLNGRLSFLKGIFINQSSKVYQP